MLQPTLCCVNHCQVPEINQVFSVVFGHMKQDRLIFNYVMNETGWHFMLRPQNITKQFWAHNMLFTWGSQKKHKGNAYKEKKRVRKREGRKKALSPRTATVEMEMQRKRVDTSCKNWRTSSSCISEMSGPLSKEKYLLGKFKRDKFRPGFGLNKLAAAS